MVKGNRMDSKEKGIYTCRSWFDNLSGSRSINWMVVLSACCLVGCTTIKKAGVTAIAAAVGATAGTVLSTGVAAPILGGTTGAFVGSVGTSLLSPSSKGKDMTDCAPDNFWSLLGSLIEMGGWALILIVIVPMVFSWLMPGPIQFKKREK